MKMGFLLAVVAGVAVVFAMLGVFMTFLERFDK